MEKLTVQCTLHTALCTLYTRLLHPHWMEFGQGWPCTLYGVQAAWGKWCEKNRVKELLDSDAVRCTPYAVHRTLCSVRCTLYAVHCTLFTVRCSLYAVYKYVIPEWEKSVSLIWLFLVKISPVQCTIEKANRSSIVRAVRGEHSGKPNETPFVSFQFAT